MYFFVIRKYGTIVDLLEMAIIGVCMTCHFYSESQPGCVTTAKK